MLQTLPSRATGDTGTPGRAGLHGQGVAMLTPPGYKPGAECRIA